MHWIPLMPFMYWNGIPRWCVFLKILKKWFPEMLEVMRKFRICCSSTRSIVTWNPGPKASTSFPRTYSLFQFARKITGPKLYFWNFGPNVLILLMISAFPTLYVLSKIGFLCFWSKSLHVSCACRSFCIQNERCTPAPAISKTRTWLLGS